MKLLLLYSASVFFFLRRHALINETEVCYIVTWSDYVACLIWFLMFNSVLFNPCSLADSLSFFEHLLDTQTDRSRSRIRSVDLLYNIMGQKCGVWNVCMLVHVCYRRRLVSACFRILMHQHSEVKMNPVSCDDTDETHDQILRQCGMGN